MNNIDLQNIETIFNNNFIIPSYQRGYRWTCKNGEVEALLEDIKEFQSKKSSSDKYCLNPVAVKKIDDNTYNIVDGQQRITTIYLILKYLEYNKDINIKYEISSDDYDKSNYLKTLDETKKDDNIDYYHIYNAYNYIEKWFNSEENINKEDFKNTLLKNVFVIWYDIVDDDEKKAFIRLNDSKIPLTNSELIKALFLRKSNFDNNINKQINMANQWESIEIELSDDKFWYFISNSQEQMRMDLLLELIYDLDKKNDNTDNRKYKIFEYFYKEFNNNKKTVEENWKKITKYFYTLKEWYNDDKLYNNIGYLIQIDSKYLQTLLEEYYKSKTKVEFRRKLLLFIKKSIINNKEIKTIKDIEILKYKQHNDEIKRVLLLFNIIESDREKIRFPFDKYNKISPSLEHIHARASDDISDKEKEEYVKNHIGYIYNKLDKIKENKQKDENKEELLTNIKSLYNIIKYDSKKYKYNIIDFQNIQEALDLLFNFDNEDIDSIGNLAILDRTHNSSFNNSIFPIKLKKLKKLDNKKYIPIATKNVFLKYYTKEVKDIYIWSEIDREDYTNSIKNSIKEYIEDTEK